MPPRTCKTCGYPSSIKHSITECRDPQEVQRKFNITEHLHCTLSTNEHFIKNILLFMKYIKLYNLV